MKKHFLLAALSLLNLIELSGHFLPTTTSTSPLMKRFLVTAYHAKRTIVSSTLPEWETRLKEAIKNNRLNDTLKFLELIENHSTRTLCPFRDDEIVELLEQKMNAINKNLEYVLELKKILYGTKQLEFIDSSVNKTDYLIYSYRSHEEIMEEKEEAERNRNKVNLNDNVALFV